MDEWRRECGLWFNNPTRGQAYMSPCDWRTEGSLQTWGQSRNLPVGVDARLEEGINCLHRPVGAVPMPANAGSSVLRYPVFEKLEKNRWTGNENSGCSVSSFDIVVDLMEGRQVPFYSNTRWGCEIAPDFTSDTFTTNLVNYNSELGAFARSLATDHESICRTSAHVPSSYSQRAHTGSAR